MSTRKLVKLFTDLQKDLDKDGPYGVWRVRKKLADTIFRIQDECRKYERDKVKYGLNVKFFEGGKPYTKKDLENIKAAQNIRRAINRRLRDMRKGK